jgi:hypothetical protein
VDVAACVAAAAAVARQEEIPLLLVPQSKLLQCFVLTVTPVLGLFATQAVTAKIKPSWPQQGWQATHVNNRDVSLAAQVPVSTTALAS